MSSSVRLAIAVSLLVLLAACSGGRVSPAPSVRPAGPPAPPSASTPAVASIVLIRSPTCSCCAGHEAYLAGLGYDVSSRITEDYLGVKDAHAIPADMRSCHTSLVGRYFVEGHVPAEAIAQLLRDQPAIDGIALPGMPVGAPGMGGVAEGPLTVFAIADGELVGEFGRFTAPPGP